MSFTPRNGDEGGFLTVEWMFAVGISLIFLTMMMNLVVIQYAQGVVRSAADEGARAGATFTLGLDPATDNAAAQSRCGSRASSVLGGLLSGTMGNGINVQCNIVADGQGNEQVEAHVHATFAFWLPVAPAITENAIAYSVKEKAPA